MKRAPFLANSTLPEEHGAAVADLDGYRDCQQQWAEHDEQQERGEPIERGLHDSSRSAELRLADLEQRQTVNRVHDDARAGNVCQVRHHEQPDA